MTPEQDLDKKRKRLRLLMLEEEEAAAAAAPERKQGDFNLSDPTDFERAAAVSGFAQPPPQERPRSLLDVLGGAARYTADAANRASTNWLQGATGQLGHAVFPHVFAAIDEGREMFNAASPALYEDRVRRHRSQWDQHLDPNVSSIGAIPVSMGLSAVAPAMNTLAGIASQAAIQSGGSLDQRGVDLSTPSGAGRAMFETAVGTAIPYGLQGLGWVGSKTAEALAPVGRTIRDIARGGYVRPTPEARRLAAEGIDLTLGQMDPGSPISRFEEIAANNALGTPLANTRAGTANATRDLLIGKAAAPGAQPPPAGPVLSQLDDLRAGYDQLYNDALDGIRIQPELYQGKGKWAGLFTDEALAGSAKTKGAFEKAIEVPDASDSVKARALEKLKDLASRNALTPRKSGADVGTVEARAVHGLRRDLRTLKRKYAKGTGDEAPQFEEIYKRAEDFVTELLEGQLPAQNVSKLRSADAKFRDLLAVEDAADGRIAHRNKGEFTVDNLLDAIRNVGGVSPGLNRTAHDVRKVLTQTYPKTGALPGAANVLLEGKYVGPLWARLANSSPGLKAHALRQSPVMSRAVSLADLAAGAGSEATTLSQSPAATSSGLRTLMDLLRGTSGLPALTEEEGELSPWARGP